MFHVKHGALVHRLNNLLNLTNKRVKMPNILLTILLNTNIGIQKLVSKRH